MDILDDMIVDEFTLTQPVDGGMQTVKVITQKNIVKRSVSANRTAPTKQSRCSDTLDWVEVETGVKYRKLGKNEKGGY